MGGLLRLLNFGRGRIAILGAVLLFLVGGSAQALAPAERNQTAWQVAEIYVATLGYAPDAEGLAYWVNNIDTGMLDGHTNSPWTPLTVAQSFFDQPLVQTAYPDSLGAGVLVDALYQNIFDRPADREGRVYWVEQLRAGSVERNAVILALLNGGWANPAAAEDMARFGNRIRVSLAFAEQQETHGLVYSELPSQAQEKLRQIGGEILEPVTADVRTVRSAIAQAARALEQQMPGGGADEPATDAALLGVWESVCHTPSGRRPADNVIKRAFANGRILQTVTTFTSSDGTCSGESFDVAFTFSYEVGEAFVTSEGVTARAIDSTLEEDPQGVFSGPETSYDVYHVDAAGQLYFSSAEAARPEDRPNTLDFNVPYTRSEASRARSGC